VNSILVIKFINLANAPLVAFPVESAVAVGFAILIVPLLDTLRVFSIRIINGRSPFTPDRNHVHHLLLDRGLNHAAVTFTCVAINIVFIILAYLGRFMGTTWLLLSMLVLAFTGFGFLYYRRSRHTLVIAKSINGTAELKTTSKVVTLTQEAVAADQN
jgi:UDP-N-acetylmuramyl pentapeptide phosphotransferase/UDP-N-acetylglucosamine-1-phosphate transferase